MDTDDSVSTAFDVGERQVVAVLPGLDRVGLTFVTGDGTKVYRSKGHASRATYTSKVFDSGAPARFGSLSWRGRAYGSFDVARCNGGDPNAYRLRAVAISR